MNNLQKAEWYLYRMELRHHLAGILHKIEHGAVDASELVQLHNYVMTTLMLLAKTTPGTWENAKKDTEIAALLRDEMIDIDEGETNDSK